MKEFIKYIVPYIKTFNFVKLNRDVEITTSTKVLKHLNLKNLNQLRDRYEGQAFFNKNMKKIGGLIACQKFMKMPVSDIISIDLNNFNPSITLNSTIIPLFIFEYGQLPQLTENDLLSSKIFIIKKENLSYIICGFASFNVIQNNLIISNKSKSTFKFTGFNQLLQLNEL